MFLCFKDICRDLPGVRCWGNGSGPNQDSVPWCPHCRKAMESNAHVSDGMLSRDQAQAEKEHREGVGSGVPRDDY